VDKKYRYPLLAGIFIVLVGVIYEVGVIGIPPQDPTPEVALQFRHDIEFAKWIKLTGAVVGVSVFLWRVFELFRSRHRQKQH
jgi:hypothetical protein